MACAVTTAAIKAVRRHRGAMNDIDKARMHVCIGSYRQGRFDQRWSSAVSINLGDDHGRYHSFWYGLSTERLRAWMRLRHDL